MRNISVSKYAAAFSITALVFILGMFVGQFVGNDKIDRITEIEGKARLNLLGLNVQSNLIKQQLCTSDLFSLTEDRSRIGREVDALEKIFGTENPLVLNLKEEYILLSINQMLLVQEYRQRCNEDFNTIIFFYSNAHNKAEAENQGYVLDYIYGNYNSTVAIYAVDADISNVAVQTLKDIYNITYYPSLVINDQKYEGLQNREFIEEKIIK